MSKKKIGKLMKIKEEAKGSSNNDNYISIIIIKKKKEIKDKIQIKKNCRIKQNEMKISNKIYNNSGENLIIGKISALRFIKKNSSDKDNILLVLFFVFLFISFDDKPRLG